VRARRHASRSAQRRVQMFAGVQPRTQQWRAEPRASGRQCAYKPAKRYGQARSSQQPQGVRGRQRCGGTRTGVVVAGARCGSKRNAVCSMGVGAVRSNAGEPGSTRIGAGVEVVQQRGKYARQRRSGQQQPCGRRTKGKPAVAGRCGSKQTEPAKCRGTKGSQRKVVASVPANLQPAARTRQNVRRVQAKNPWCSNVQRCR